MRNNMYQMTITCLENSIADKIEETFKDRDVKIDRWPVKDDGADGICDIEITNIHPVTMTPLMIWLLHHTENDSYYSIEIV